jgi:hypothetical protein
MVIAIGEDPETAARAADPPAEGVATMVGSKPWDRRHQGRLSWHDVEGIVRVD